MDNLKTEKKYSKYKKNHGVSILSLLSLIFVVPSITILILNYMTDIRIPVWIAIVTSAIAMVIAVVDLEIGRIEKVVYLHFISDISAFISVGVITLSITFLIIGSYIAEINSSFTENINKKIDDFNNQEEKDSERKSDKVTVTVGDGITYGDAVVNLTKCYEYTDYEDWNAPKNGNKIVVFEFEVENNNEDNFYFNAYNFEGYADNVKAEFYYMDSAIDLDLAKGRTGTGTVAFEVPEGAKNIEADYSFDYLNTGCFVYQ